LKARLYVGSGAILVLGIFCSVLIYLVADEDNSANEVGYVIAGGVSYPIAPNQSKRYIRDLERFGGKSAVIFDEINRWFDGLWRGKALGVTIGWISVLVSLGLFLFARWLPPDRK
jgi:tetrahydromethanopterin S-methyltransferase subunit A